MNLKHWKDRLKKTLGFQISQCEDSQQTKSALLHRQPIVLTVT
jgi:hypothetical protein